MPEIVETHLSFFEAGIEFVEPNLKLWLDRIAVVQAIYTALRPWNVSVDDIEVINTGKPSEQGVKFKIPEKRASFYFGAASCRFTRDSTNWQTAPETIQILDAALKAFTSNSTTELKTFKTAVALHVQPKTKPFLALLRPLIPPEIAALDTDSPTAMAVIVKWDNRRVTIDGSAQIANGLFIRYERDFPGTTEYETIAKQLYDDEFQIFRMLDVSEE
jgi:hypothetical protein